MSAETTRRHAAAALDRLIASRVTLELISCVPGHPETTERVRSTRYLLSALHQATARVVLSALRSGTDASGATVTLVALLPVATASGGASRERWHIAELLYSESRWWQSTDGQRWQPIDGSETPAVARPLATRSPS